MVLVSGGITIVAVKKRYFRNLIAMRNLLKSSGFFSEFVYEASASALDASAANIVIFYFR